MADPRLKQLMIKTGVVRRIAKEKVSYEKEARTQVARIERLKGEGQDDHVLRKEEEVLQESYMMVPDCQRRLAKAYEELDQFLKTEIELHESEEYTKAQVVLAESKEHLPQQLQ